MKVISAEWQGRLSHWIRVLKEDFYESLGEFSWEAFRTMDHLPMEDAEKGLFVPVETGYT